MAWSSLKAVPAALIVAGAMVAFPAVANADTVDDGYYITVAPTSQDPGQSVTVTGDGQYYTEPFSGDNCDEQTITVTVTYYTISGTQKSAQTSLGVSDGNGDTSGQVAVPDDAAPTSFNGKYADFQASCVTGDPTTYLSNVVQVTVAGTVPTTTTTTATTTTTTTVASTTTTSAAATTTTVPVTTTTVPQAPAAAAVTGAPKLTG